MLSLMMMMMDLEVGWPLLFDDGTTLSIQYGDSFNKESCEEVWERRCELREKRERE